MLYVEPEAGIKPIVDFIRSSKNTLDINCYLIDDTVIIEEIKNAVKRKVKVRIMVDGRPYGGSGSHLEISDLQKTGAQVKIAPSRFEKPGVFDHAKYMVNDDSVEIGTANLTEAAFIKNREYILIERNSDLVEDLSSVFNADWQDSEAGKKPRKGLVISPGSETDLANLIEEPGKIFIETEEMGDDKKVLETLEKKGKKIYIIVPSTVSGEDQVNIKALTRKGVRFRFMNPDHVYMHAKLILSKKRFFTGSENFSTSSLNKNREVGIIMDHRHYMKILRKTFKADWKMADTKIPKS
ncbi:MAG: phospholipase D-like domain-containing protein [Candidatus Thermoplasmatota archaeon]|nr:phospholipase D-like domain-containing protein [Candidatus Thermoplasmatota archaeon]MCL5666051.1 phospholipase D-like domain-containing protein [Candidatus Thermoplasmatota archaeon]